MVLPNIVIGPAVCLVDVEPGHSLCAHGGDGYDGGEEWGRGRGAGYVTGARTVRPYGVFFYSCLPRSLVLTSFLLSLHLFLPLFHGSSPSLVVYDPASVAFVCVVFLDVMVIFSSIPLVFGPHSREVISAGVIMNLWPLDLDHCRTYNK